PSSASFSSSAVNARLSARTAAKLKVTQRMLGARSRAAMAVGARPYSNTTSTSAGDTRASINAARGRGSAWRSLRVTSHACRTRSATGHDPAKVGRQGGGITTCERSVSGKAPISHERDLGRELRAFVHVVGDQDGRSPGARQLREQRAQLFG